MRVEDVMRRGVFQVYSRRDQERQNDQAAALEADTAARLSPAARYILDASGRDTFLAGKLGLKSADKRNNTAAVFDDHRLL